MMQLKTGTCTYFCPAAVQAPSGPEATTPLFVGQQPLQQVADLIADSEAAGAPAPARACAEAVRHAAVEPPRELQQPYPGRMLGDLQLVHQPGDLLRVGDARRHMQDRAGVVPDVLQCGRAAGE